MSVSIPPVTLVQGSTIALGATTFSKPISVGEISLPNETIEIPDVSSNTTVAVPGKQGTGTVDISVNYIEAEYTAVLGYKTARTQQDLVITTPAVQGGSNTTTFTAATYVMDVKTPAIQHGQTAPASMTISLLVLSIAGV